MRKVSGWVTCVVLAAAFAATLARGANRKEQADLVEGNNAFALDLYAELKGEDGNLFFSPFSISTALAMTYAGARGETAAQMKKTLHLPDKPHAAFKPLLDDLNKRQKRGHYQLSVANALWGQKGYGFLKPFLGLTRGYYGAGLRELDFRQDADAARKVINQWVEEQTNSKIKDLIPQRVLDAETRLVLTNAIYFKGNWAEQFDKLATREEPFILARGKKVNVPMMRQIDELRYMETKDLQVLALPYKGKDLSMVVLLPRKANGIASLEAALTQKQLAGWLARMRSREAHVAFPKFKVTSSFSLGATLGAMGMKDAFRLPPADFSGMNGRKDLYISAVIHKAFVDVNEEGTEAAAATAVVATEAAGEPRGPVVFRADHPFVFLIRDNKTGSILFMGRVMNPKG